MERREPEADHHRARDSHGRSEATGALDDGAERKRDQQALEPSVERDVSDRFLDDLKLPADQRKRVEEHRADDDPDDADSPVERARDKCRYGGARGPAHAQQRDEKRGDDAAKGCPWRDEPNMSTAIRRSLP